MNEKRTAPGRGSGRSDVYTTHFINDISTGTGPLNLPFENTALMSSIPYAHSAEDWEDSLSIKHNIEIKQWSQMVCQRNREGIDSNSRLWREDRVKNAGGPVARAQLERVLDQKRQLGVWYGTVEPRFQERRPLSLQCPLATQITLLRCCMLHFFKGK